MIFSTSTWASVSLAKLEFPVAMHYADITGNGFNDGKPHSPPYPCRTDHRMQSLFLIAMAPPWTRTSGLTAGESAGSKTLATRTTKIGP